MATIRTTLSLQDGMSAKLKAIQKAIDNVIGSLSRFKDVSGDNIAKSFERANTSAVKTYHSVTSIKNAINGVKDAQVQLNGAVKGTVAGNKNIKNAIKANTTAQDGFNKKVKSGYTHVNQLARTLRGLSAAYLGVEGVKGVFNTADRLTMARSRIGLMSDVASGATTTDAVNDNVYAAAMRSRGSYLDMMDSVSKLSLQTGDLFKGSDEVISFMENYNKMAVISGANSQQTAAALLQITQALSSGELRGDELRSVLENMPVIAQYIAKELGVTVDQVREMGHEGKISADVLRNAMLGSADEVDAKFKQMPYTWGQVWQTIENFAVRASEPILKAISAITNNKRFIAFANEMGNIFNALMSVLMIAFNALKPVLNWLFDSIAGIYNFFKNNWATIAPIVVGVATAFGYLKLATLAYNGVMLINAIRTGIVSFFQSILAAKTALATGATWTQVVAQYGLNTALLACPITWIVLGIIALIAVIYLAVWALNKWAGTSLSATGIVMGAFNVLYAVIWNIIAAIWDKIASLIEFFVNAWRNPMYTVKKLFVDLATKVIDIAIKLRDVFKNLGTTLANAFKSAINWVVEKWNSLLDSFSGKKKASVSAEFKMPELSGSLEDWKSQLQGWLGEEPKDTFKLQRMEMKSLGDAWNNGYKKGESLGNSLSTKKGLKDLLGGNGLLKGVNLDALGLGDENDIGKALKGGLGNNPASGISRSLGNIEDSVGNIEDTVSDSEELDFIRDMAEREAINRYTLTDLKVEVSNTNNINNKVDEQDMLDKICAAVYDGVRSGAQGVYT